MDDPRHAAASPVRKECFLTSCDAQRAEFLTPSAFAAPQKSSPMCFLSLSWAERAHQHQQRSQAWLFLLTVNHVMCRGTGRKRKNEGIKILHGGVLPAQSVHLLSPGRLERPAHRAMETSCHPWHCHTIWCAITAGMFPELVMCHIRVAT